MLYQPLLYPLALMNVLKQAILNHLNMDALMLVHSQHTELVITVILATIHAMDALEKVILIVVNVHQDITLLLTMDVIAVVPTHI